MRPMKVVLSSATTSIPLPINWRHPNQFNVGIGVVITGTATYKVQHTFDNPWDTTVTPTWFDQAECPQVNVNKYFNYDFPIAAVRLNVTAYTSGTITMTVISAG